MNKEYFIKIEDGTRVKVSRDIFRQYWKLTNRENYLKRLDRKYGGVSLDAKANGDSAFINLLESDFDLEKVVETALLIEELNKALKNLNEKELDLIKKLFYEEKSMRELAREEDVSTVDIMKRRDRILLKLKNILKFHLICVQSVHFFT